MCGLSLAWVTSENSTMLLESDILRLFFTGPYLVSSPLCSVSGVDCPSVDPRQPLCSPLSCPAATAFSLLSSHQLPLLVSCHQLSLLGSSHQLPLSGSRRQLSFSGPATNSHSRVQPPTLLSPVQLPTASLGLQPPTASLLSCHQLPLLGRVVNSHSPPHTTSGYGEISCPRILCLVSRQNRQLNRLLWQPTPIVLHKFNGEI